MSEATTRIYGKQPVNVYSQQIPLFSDFTQSSIGFQRETLSGQRFKAGFQSYLDIVCKGVVEQVPRLLCPEHPTVKISRNYVFIEFCRSAQYWREQFLSFYQPELLTQPHSQHSYTGESIINVYRLVGNRCHCFSQYRSRNFHCSELIAFHCHDCN